MADDSATPSWQNVDNAFDFQQDAHAPAHIPRGWERAPQPSHLARHKGRKVWKRSETRAKDPERLEEPLVDEQRNPLRDVSTNTPRPVKRLRVRDDMAGLERKTTGGVANYFTTLRDGGVGTPKRKYTSRKSLKPDKRSQGTEVLEQVIDGEAKEEVGENSPQAEESPALAQLGGLLQGENAPLIEEEEEANGVLGKDSNCEEQTAVMGQPAVYLAQETNEQASKLDGTLPMQDGADPVLPAKAGLLKQSMETENTNENTGSSTISDAGKDAEKTDEALCTKKLLETSSSAVPPTQTPKSTRRNTRATPKLEPTIEHSHECDSPQIGTTLLRRESLRSKGSPRKRSSAQKSKTPKRNGLKKRDTLQEREILQQFTENLEAPNADAAPSKTSPDQKKVPQESVHLAGVSAASPKHEFHQSMVVDTPNGKVILKETILDNKDLQRAVEAIQVCQTSNEDDAIATLNSAPPSAEANSNLDQANDFIAHTEVEQAAHTIVEECEKAEVLPTRKTRSTARFSDDTSMLQDFLHRAQAKKAAKDIPSLSAAVTPKLEPSPARRSPRKAHEPQHTVVISPRKSKKLTGRPTTPPRTPAAEDIESSDDQEITNEPVAFRRSSRTRLPAPSKAPPGAPSLIPVRRGDGADAVVLQKSHAQEVAIVTRANTRRNKGPSKPPALALQELPAESPVRTSARERAAQAKRVVWAEQLASFHASTEAAEEGEEQRGQVRRMRGLGNVNGTPAAKKSAAVVPPSNGTPAPKRRSKPTK